jgi:hypothetical protein
MKSAKGLGSSVVFAFLVGRVFEAKAARRSRLIRRWIITGQRWSSW